MTEGPIAAQMIRFALPLFVGNLFQQLYNTVDALIVGNLIGSDALAAVSATGSLVYLIISFFSGISVGAGVIVSRYFGAGEPDKLRRAMHAAMSFDGCSALLLTIAGTLLTPGILRLMGTPDAVMPGATAYVRVYFAGSIGLVLYNSCRGIMQALGDSRHPLQYLVLSSLVNVVLDLLMIAVFHMGVEGAALATVLSQLISVALCLRRLMSPRQEYRIELRRLGFDWPMLWQIVRYGLPSGLQNSVIGFANVVVQANINAFGALAVAGCGAYSKIEGFAFLPITSFTIALTTFVGQNLGAREYERAKRGARFGVLCTVLLAELIGIATFLAAPLLITAFTRDPEAVAFGVGKARICALFFCLLAASHSIAAVLRGAGKAVIPMISMLCFWCVVRVSILHFAVPVYQTIDVVNWVYPITWSLSTVFLVLYALKADWLHSFDREKS